MQVSALLVTVFAGCAVILADPHAVWMLSFSFFLVSHYFQLFISGSLLTVKHKKKNACSVFLFPLPNSTVCFASVSYSLKRRK
jgi:hypothetical protein